MSEVNREKHSMDWQLGFDTANRMVRRLADKELDTLRAENERLLGLAKRARDFMDEALRNGYNPSSSTEWGKVLNAIDTESVNARAAQQQKGQK